MSARNQRDDGKLYAISGSARQGKTLGVMQAVAKALRCLVWDVRGEWLSKGFTCVKSLSSLAKLLRECGDDQHRFAYWGALGDFDGFCELAYVWGMLWPAAIVVDELADVTNPGKAPPGWGQLIRKGLYYGNHIYAITQRPAESDKTVWGNASVLRCYHMVSPNDQDYMGSRLVVPSTEIALLKPLEYLERPQGGDIKRGKLIV
jgi:hypothetical protein